MRCKRFKAAARRDEEKYPHGSSTDEQRGSSLYRSATLGAEQWRAAGRVASQSQNAAAMLLRRALPATRHYSAHPFLFVRWVLKSLTLPDSERDHISGSANGSIKLLEYGDYECPFCAEAQPIIKEIQRRLGDDLLFAFRHFPLTNIHPHSEHAAEAAEAAGAQGNFWGMHNLLFENQGALEDEDLAAYAAELGLDEKQLIREVASSVYAPRIREDFKSGVRGGVNGTPTFFINGERYDGARDLKHLLNAVTSQSA